MKLVQSNREATLLAVRFRSETAVNLPLGIRVAGLIVSGPQPAPEVIQPSAVSDGHEFGSFTALNSLMLQFRDVVTQPFTCDEAVAWLTGAGFKSNYPGHTVRNRLAALEKVCKARRVGWNGKAILWSFAS